MPYVVVGPGDQGRLFETWDECEKFVRARRGVRFMRVDDPVEAQAVLDGGVTLPAGLFMFTDANAAGGIGIVLVRGQETRVDEPEVVGEWATTVADVLTTEPVGGLRTTEQIAAALSSLANILAELVALLEGLRRVPEGSEVTIVYDYKGVEAFVTGAFRARDEPIKDVVVAIKSVIGAGALKVQFRHQRGHRSTWARRHDYARFNRRADELAGQAVQ